jgi:nitrogen fixation protein FixH
MRAPRRPRELTGKHVLICFLGFFGLVFAANAVMVKAAMSTFGGVQTTSSYKAGLAFGQDVARAGQQDALHWQVNGKLSRDGTGNAVLDISVRDPIGIVVSGLTAQARLAHPADERRDHFIALDDASAGRFRGVTRAEPGRWELIVDLFKNDARVFRSRSRVMLNSP